MRCTWLAVSWLMVSGCASATGDSGAPLRNSDPAVAVAGRWGAAVTAPGGSVVGDVLFLDGSGNVVAEAPIANGRYELAAQPAARRAVIRLEAPVVGIRELPIAGTAAPALAVAAADVVRLHAVIELPASVVFDWVDLEITPVADQPPTVVLWSDARGSLRAAVVRRRLAAPSFDLGVLRGSHRINVSRIVDGPKGSAGPTLVLDHAQLGSTVVAAALGGATLALQASGDARFVLRSQP